MPVRTLTGALEFYRNYARAIENRADATIRFKETPVGMLIVYLGYDPPLEEMIMFRRMKTAFLFSLLSVVLIILIATSCTNATTSPTLTPEIPQTQDTATSEVGYISHEVRPSETDEAINNWNEPHYLCVPALDDQRSGKLWVFLPGTRATPDYYTMLTQEAARAGLHSVCLRYPNDESVNIQICPYDTDPNCHEKVREEIISGVAVSKHITVDTANSIEGRLKSLLMYLRNQFPDEGWEQYLDINSEVVWSSIVVAGHSQGAGHAVYIAYKHRVNHAVGFSWADVRKGSLAPWLTEKPSQTPPEGYYLFWHRDDTNVAGHQPALMTVLGIDQFGNPVITDESTPPYDGSHALIATVPPPTGERAHNTHVADKALNFDEDGNPVYSTVWRFLFSPQTSGTLVPQAANQMGEAERSVSPVQRDYSGSIEVGGLTRTYNVHLPTRYDGSKSFPLILAFHLGYMQGRGMDRLTHLSETADQEGFIVVYPDGYKRSWAGPGLINPAQLEGVDTAA